jgi:hemerythrin-like domain-containing protein
MQARGPLMIEHRLIERMIGQIRRLLENIGSSRRIDPYLIDTAVDFIRTYADRTHHGKEEDILFRELGKKGLSPTDQTLMDELIADHIYGRRLTAALVAANDRYRQGENGALKDIQANLQALVDFYPKHIEKEDKIFFPASRRYFTEEEDQAMLQEFWRFDREIIHHKYRAVVDELQKQ